MGPFTAAVNVTEVPTSVEVPDDVSCTYELSVCTVLLSVADELVLKFELPEYTAKS